MAFPNHSLPCINTTVDSLYAGVCGQVIAADFSGTNNDFNSIYNDCAATHRVSDTRSLRVDTPVRLLSGSGARNIN